MQGGYRDTSVLKLSDSLKLFQVTRFIQINFIQENLFIFSFEVNDEKFSYKPSIWKDSKLERLVIFFINILLVGQPCISMRVLGINLHQTQNTENKKMETQDTSLLSCQQNGLN